MENVSISVIHLRHKRSFPLGSLVKSEAFLLAVYRNILNLLCSVIPENDSVL
jgi:hypothetical protein